MASRGRSGRGDPAPGVQGWPGQRLGLPPDGSRSVARPGRRLAGVVADWLLALLVSGALLGGDPWTTLGVFAVLHVVGVGTLGGSPGHLLLGMRVLRLDGAWPGPLRALVRTVLLCVVVPAAIWDADQRGTHDRLAGTVLLRR